jgi:hypothetical protein
MAGTGRRRGRAVVQTAWTATAATQASVSGEQSRRFLLVLGNTKRKPMVCALSWFWNETTKIHFVQLLDIENQK